MFRVLPSSAACKTSSVPPSPTTLAGQTDTGGFKVLDASGQALIYVYARAVLALGERKAELLL
ncbi:unnamed protein product [marine sediment metagenome]|uniref:Uncharacterized protein n=1 Tax=marine sediment metagenome TaxID=412755 RepID=X1BFX3_9ZZZZ